MSLLKMFLVVFILFIVSMVITYLIIKRKERNVLMKFIVCVVSLLIIKALVLILLV